MTITKKSALSLLLCLAMVISFTPFTQTFAHDDPVTVTFNLNGGSGTTPAALTLGIDGKIPAAQIPDGTGISRTGYSFKGWYVNVSALLYGMMAAEDHVIIDANTEFKENTVVYAAWQADIDFVVTSSAGIKVTLGISPSTKLLDKDGDPLAALSAAYDPDADGSVFKDLNGNGQLDAYEDWRKPVADRVNDLADKIAAGPKSIEKMAGLMLYSSHQQVMDPYIGTIQKDFLSNDYLRHVLIATVGDPVDVARWNNNVQAYLEGVTDDYGIPANNSSDPRHGASSLANAEYSTMTGGISAWPSSLGIAATFNKNKMLEFGKIASTEYRLMGLATALSPQIDIATDPRWSRFSGTFGEDPKLAADMAAAYVRGFQSTYEVSNSGAFGSEAAAGWGPYSVNAMIKHWPGGGAGEGGQDAHYAYGKYAVYPGGNFNAHLIPFVDGAFGTEVGPTGKATAVMPYYTISYLQVPGSEPNLSDTAAAKLNMANAYSKYMITDLLRGAYKFAGVVCTDWNVIGPSESAAGSMFGPTPGMIWGVDDHYPSSAGFTRKDRQDRADLLLRAGVNQFGGLNSIEPIVDAYETNPAAILPFIKDSTKALLSNIFVTGLFENPYIEISGAEAILGNQAFVEAGYQTQLDSMVLLKNKGNVLPLQSGTKVFVPGAAGGRTTGATVNGNTLALLKSYFGTANVITNSALASSADIALVFGASMISGGGSYNTDGSINFKPAVLDYKAYTANNSREYSVAGSPIRNASGAVAGRTNNSYKGKSASPFDPIPGFFGTSPSTLPNFLEDISLAKASGAKIVLSLTLTNPMVMEDIEPDMDAILVDFENQKSAVLDMLFGKTKNRAPSGATVNVKPDGLLPMQMPLNMAAVEAQYEDVPRDMTPYVDTEGHVWDFGFGLTYGTSSPLAIPAVYRAPALTTPLNPDGKAAIAERIRVSFDYDNDGKADFVKIVKSGTKATDIVDPVPSKSNYKLTGWQLGTAAYDFDSIVTTHTALSAIWVYVPPASGGSSPGGSSGKGSNGGLSSPSGTPSGSADNAAIGGSGSIVGGGSGSAWGSSAPDFNSISAWAYEYFGRLLTEGIISGRADGTLDPKGDVTRAEFTKMIVLSLKIEAGEAPKAFNDVQAGDWFKEFADKASGNDIVNGVSEGRFAPNDKISRQDICTIIYRAFNTLKIQLPPADASSFPDASSISDYAKDAVYMLKQLGIVSGRDSGSFDPLAFATREETAKIVAGVMDYAASASLAASAAAATAAASVGEPAADAPVGGEAGADAPAGGEAGTNSVTGSEAGTGTRR